MSKTKTKAASDSLAKVDNVSLEPESDDEWEWETDDQEKTQPAAPYKTSLDDWVNGTVFGIPAWNGKRVEIDLADPNLELADLIPIIQEGKKSVYDGLNKTVWAMRATGELLLKAKELVGHGNFMTWLKVNVEMSVETARRYMRIAENWEVVGRLLQRNQAINQTQALELIRGTNVKPQTFPNVNTNDTEFAFALRRLQNEFKSYLERECSYETVHVINEHFEDLMYQFHMNVYKLMADGQYAPHMPADGLNMGTFDEFTMVGGKVPIERLY